MTEIEKNKNTDKKVLLVEDDLLLAKMIGHKISNAGFVFNHTENGEDTLKLLESLIPDVILLDILLPGGMDGFEVLEKIKQKAEWKHIPVVILSNLGESSDVDKGLSLGAYRYIVKASIVPGDVLTYIEDALHSPIK